MQSNCRLAIIGLLFIASLFAILSCPAAYGEEKEQAVADGMWISGQVIWPGHDLTKASVKVFKDPQFKELYTEGFLLKPEGVYGLTMDDPGTYYIVAFVDDNGDSRFDAGDGMGIYGVADWADPDQKPKPVRLEKGMNLPGIDIQITAVVSDQGRMMPISSLESGIVTGISGKLIWLNPPSPPFTKGGINGGFSKGEIKGDFSQGETEGDFSQGEIKGDFSQGETEGEFSKGETKEGSSKGESKEEKGIFSNAIVFVYSDPSWSNRIAQTNVKETGEYEVSVPAGRYYLLAVIDENETNLLDVGDKFGIWGMTRFGMFPKAVEVNEGRVTKDRNILIIGQMSVSGKPLPLDVGTAQKQSVGQGQVEKVVSSEDKVILSGNVVWPGHDLKFGMVQAYDDPSMTVAAASCRLEPNDEGRFRLAIPPGDYYIVAGVDADGDGKYTTGDGIGAYGVADAADQMPEKLTVTAAGLEGIPANEEINLVITAEFDASGQLKPISQYSTQESSIRYPASSIRHPVSGTQYTGISGKIVWEGREVSRATLIFSNEPRFESGIRTPLQLEDDGSYNCSTPPGDYYIMAIIDDNNDDKTNSGDGIGFYGAGYSGAPQKVTVLEGRTTPYININVTASFGPDGRTVPIRTPGSIRFQYGEPDDIYTDSTSQEWWYWDKGIVFTFEETDAGWNLIDTYEFTPVGADHRTRSPEKTLEPSQAEIPPHPPFPKGGKEDFDGTLYYTFDRSIWAMEADGTGRRWIAPGTRPTATLDGSKLLFLDTSGNIYLIELGDDASPQLVLGQKKAGVQPAVSHNGKVAAFTQDSGGYRRIVLKNLETGEESAIPAGAMDMCHPAWSLDDELIAYSASPISSADQQDRNRDIYYYDLVAGQVGRVSISPLDEFEPAWSPIDKRALVYCRAEGEHAQLWIAHFDDDGKPVERQLTKYGGQNPAWSPTGDKIIYENNAQIWTINPNGSDESPMIVDDEPVFGMDPFWTR